MHGFAGEQLDPTGLYFNRARYYSPSLGRFIGRDTTVGTPNDPLSMNRFIYGQDNPALNADPSGLRVCEGNDGSSCIPVNPTSGNPTGTPSSGGGGNGAPTSSPNTNTDDGINHAMSLQRTTLNPLCLGVAGAAAETGPGAGVAFVGCEGLTWLLGITLFAATAKQAKPAIEKAISNVVDSTGGGSGSGGGGDNRDGLNQIIKAVVEGIVIVATLSGPSYKPPAQIAPTAGTPIVITPSITSPAVAAGGNRGNTTPTPRSNGGCQLYPNLDPNYGNIPDSAIIRSKPSTLKGLDGYYLFVLTTKGELLLAKAVVGYNHPGFVNGAPVTYAGTMTFRNGKLLKWNNDSGHYKPRGSDSNELSCVEAGFRTAGWNFDWENTFTPISGS